LEPPSRSTLAQRPTLPSGCAIAFGIPTNRSDFTQSLTDPARDYARQYLGGWSQYDKYLLAHINRYAAIYSAFGVHVIRDLTRPVLEVLFRAHAVVTVFSHWTAHGVELCDGILPIRDLVAGIPLEFSGVFDLCVCHPDDLAESIQRARPLCTVKYLSDPTDPIFWLGVYGAIYEALALDEGKTFTACLTDVVLELRR
jgi:hypothetical protein